MRLLASPTAQGRSVVGGADADARVSRRRTWPPAHPAQLPLLIASVALIVASFLPWVVTGFGTYRGVLGPGLWTFYAGIFGVAGALVPSRRLAIVHGVAAAAAGLALPLWQVQRLYSTVGFEGWSPGFGLAIAFVAGATAARATVRLVTQGGGTTLSNRGDGGSRRTP